MVDNIQSNTNLDVRAATLAALVFWKTCQYSKRYKDRIQLTKICRHHEKLIEKGREELTFKFFDITPEHVRKVYKDNLKKCFLGSILPKWKNRIPLDRDEKGRIDEYD